MSKKKSFVLRLSPEMFKALEKWAADDFRSTNGQIEFLLHKSLKEARRLPKKKEGNKNDEGNDDKPAST